MGVGININSRVRILCGSRTGDSMVLMIPSITAQQHLVSNANVSQKCGDQKETESVPISIHACLSDQPSAKGQRLNRSKSRDDIVIFMKKLPGKHL